MINPGDLQLYGSSIMPENNTTVGIGGAIDLTTQIDFYDLQISDNVQVVSDSLADTTQSITVYGRNVNGIIVSESISLNGKTPIPASSNTAWLRLEKFLKSASCTGNIAIESCTPVLVGSVLSAGPNTIQLDKGSTDDIAYAGMPIRITGGTGVGQIAKIMVYSGGTNQCVIDHQWPITPDSTSTYRISYGAVFRIYGPVEVFTIRKPFYNAAADVPEGEELTYFEKVFFRNNSSSTLYVAAVQLSDPTNSLSFALASSVNDTGTSGIGTRLVLPNNLTFDVIQEAVPSGSLNSGDAIGIWSMFSLPPGALPIAAELNYQLQGLF